MSTEYSSRDSKPRPPNMHMGINIDSVSSRDYISDSSMPPTSLWGTASNVTTLDRGHSSRHNFRAPSSHKSGVSSKVSPTETDLLREAILTLSGASGSLIQYDPTLDAFVPARHLTLPPCLQTHVMRISACGWLYNRVRSYVNDVRDDPNSGKVALSLALSIDDQLTEYLKLVSTFEAQMNYESGETLRNPTEFSVQNSSTRSRENTLSRPRGFDSGSMSILEEHSGTEGTERQPLTLVQLRHWLIEPERRLKVLASLVDNCRSLKGGALVSKVYEMSQNGGPKIKAMLTVILENVTRTIFEMISLWIYDGRLPPDMNQEFFIAVYPSVGRENLWA
ncbi:unnamed protein product [Rodentolepis nana]|uniref:Gamma-tubulin complex component n=1 Tax=Rodentolepis nana TaxID=102285 RepID=A0A0R3TQB3_RODNA|nr:unnamed protein product [Rodentolepis nana]